LSYDLKSPPEHLDVTWSQRQYLAQIQVNEGSLPNYQHPSFDQTQSYVNANGPNSLPRTMVESLMFNPVLTIKEFFKDFVYICYKSVRQLSLMLLIVLGYFLFKFKEMRQSLSKSFIPLSLLGMMSIFSLIVISYIELRWLIPVFVMTVVHFAYLEHHKKIDSRLVMVNQFLMLFLICFGIYRIIPLI
jgi:hypothetical protein